MLVVLLLFLSVAPAWAQRIFQPGGGGSGTITVLTKTLDYIAVATDSVILVDATAGAVAITLPTAAVSGTTIRVKKIDSSANAVTVTRAGADTIDGATTQVISSQYTAIDVIANGGTAWSIF
jgi:hypothetical protein